jgi:hypothetical protein
MISHVYEDNGMSNHKITEIIPDEIFNNPDLQWVRDAFEEGQFFTVVLDKIESLQAEVHKQTSLAGTYQCRLVDTKAELAEHQWKMIKTVDDLPEPEAVVLWLTFHEEGQFFIDERVHCFSWQELTTTPDDDFHLIKKHYRGWTNIPHVPPL